MFKINDIEWHIKFIPSWSEIFLLSNGTYTIGACDNTTKTIYLADTLRGYQLKKALCHELVHSAMFSYRVTLSYEQEELMADLIATYGEEIIDITNKVFQRLQ